MTDGQSEGARMSEVMKWQSSTATVADLIYRVGLLERQMAAIQPDDTDELAEEIVRDSERLQAFRRRLQYGLPLTMAEQRELVEIASGEPVEIQKRCPMCHGDGQLLQAMRSVANGQRVYQPCTQCEGSGYVA